MELQDFIRTTLIQVACGVHGAKIEVKDLVAIAPGTLNKQSHECITEIEFDVALTVSEKKIKEAGTAGKLEPAIKVLSASINTGMLGGRFKWGSEKSNEEIQRVNFKVPIILNSHFRSDENFDKEINITKEAINKIKNES